MSEAQKKNRTRYFVGVGIVLVLAAAYLLTRDFTGAETAQVLVWLCDAFTIPGLLLLCVSAITFASRQGALDGIGYALSVAGRALVPGKGVKRMKRYGDYVEEKRAKKKAGYGYLLICGGGSMALAAVFLILYLIAA